MIITLNGDVIEAVWTGNGVIQKKGIFSIFVPYTDKQKAEYAEMQTCQHSLASSDYKAIKYSEGLYTEEEYKPIKEERQKLRDRYNEIQGSFDFKYLTEEEVDEVIDKYYQKHPSPNIEGGIDNG